MDKESVEKMRELCRPVIQYLNDGQFHPHVMVVIECGRFTVHEALCGGPIHDYIKD